jgi:predicted nuclease of predicted toxin-antitoxin system
VKIKLDENLGDRGRAILEAAGHDACTVARQSLNGADDRQLIEACRAEGRALVTLDIDFANPLV